ncbi:MAG: relaxase/mobilization nuclease domain-containing protein [Oscillospiraceae bacterium]|nr:relaxase/mobilization nuclease domain-containing protein [Oscillospiraceae bacterium]
MAFGNVKVNYALCKSVGSLKNSVDYMLGKQKSQIKSGVVKTAPDLYSALGCNRDNFANSILVTRKLNGKSYSRLKGNDVLAHKLSISFHPDDNGKVNHRLAFQIAQQFAEEFGEKKGHEVLFAVHTDTKHIHAHFIISNCNINTGKSYRRNKKSLYEMSEFFGQQCLENGLTNSVRDSFYTHDSETQKVRETLPEKEMKKRGAETFKDELRDVILQEIESPTNRTFDDVIRALQQNWNVETRVAGNTVSYRHPEYRDKNNNLVSVRGSKLGELFTRKGIEDGIAKKRKRQQQQTHSTTGIEAVVGASRNDERAGQTGIGGQVSGDFALCDGGANAQSLERFYERYRKPIENVGTTADENNKYAKRVRNKGAR